MDERVILEAQIKILSQQLSDALLAIKSPKLPEELRQRAQYLFENMINLQAQRLKTLEQEVTHGLSFAEGWKRFRLIRQDCLEPFKECLALVEGALVRSTGLDNGLCQIADALLDDLGKRANIPWGRFTILAEKEFYGEMAQVIRLLFPGLSIWNLPIAAHEFGHFIGPQLKEPGMAGTFRYPFQEELQAAAQESTQQRFFLDEHFADIFATWALGPAFAYTCILLRFSPMTAFQDTQEHPSHAKRFYMIRKTLERMNLGIYMGSIDTLDEVWQQSLRIAIAKPPVQFGKEITQPLDGLFKKLYDLLDTQLYSIQYKDLARAHRLSNLLSTKESAMQILTHEPYTLIDVLNAAWICRIEKPDSNTVLQIGTKAIDLCTKIIQRRDER